MIEITKHGNKYYEHQKLSATHTYRCGYYRPCSKDFGGCGCEFTATLADFTYTVVGHGEMDYITKCPECGKTIHDMINRVD